MQTLKKDFASLGVSQNLAATLARAGIENPTPVQAAAIPLALKGHDLVAIAQTGTGKTLAFALPILQNLNPGQSALVLAPTRELAQQIAETFQKLGVRATLVVGGAGMDKQIKQLRQEPAVIVATPGRLIDHLDRKTARLKNIAVVVLDEADRMLDMGFAPAIKRILAETPRARQTLLFSATMPSEIESLAAEFLLDPEKVQIAPAGTASELVHQEVCIVPFAQKPEVLDHLLHQEKGSVLVFVRTRHGARKLAKALRDKQQTAAEIHADRTLAQRREALAGFKTGHHRVLVATDIAARGIDVKDIALVVNYDLPDNLEDYVHRIGRTGRAGAKGRSVTIALPQQARDIHRIEKLVGAQMTRWHNAHPPTPRTNQHRPAHTVPHQANLQPAAQKQSGLKDNTGQNLRPHLAPESPTIRTTTNRSTTPHQNHPNPKFNRKSKPNQITPDPQPANELPRYSDQFDPQPQPLTQEPKRHNPKRQAKHKARRDNRRPEPGSPAPTHNPQAPAARANHRGWSGRAPQKAKSHKRAKPPKS